MTSGFSWKQAAGSVALLCCLCLLLGCGSSRLHLTPIVDTDLSIVGGSADFGDLSFGYGYDGTTYGIECYRVGEYDDNLLYPMADARGAQRCHLLPRYQRPREVRQIPIRGTHYSLILDIRDVEVVNGAFSAGRVSMYIMRIDPYVLPGT